MSKFIVYSGNTKFSVKNAANFNVYDGAQSLEEYCCNYIKNISSMSVSEVNSSTGNMTINFTPITDTKVLSAVEQGQIQIRAQLLVHVSSLRVKDTTRNKFSRGLEYNLDRPTRTKTSHNFNYWFRVKPFNLDTYGATHINLTKNQLQAGQVNLAVKGTGWMGHCHARTYGKNYDLAALLYIPALGPGNPHTWIFHNNGYYKVSSNAISIPADTI